MDSNKDLEKARYCVKQAENENDITVAYHYRKLACIKYENIIKSLQETHKKNIEDVFDKIICEIKKMHFDSPWAVINPVSTSMESISALEKALELSEKNIRNLLIKAVDKIKNKYLEVKKESQDFITKYKKAKEATKKCNQHFGKEK